MKEENINEKIPAPDTSSGRVDSKPKVVETYAEDVAKIIERGEGGIVKTIIHGEEENEEERRSLSPEAKKNKIFVFSGSVIFLLALGLSAFLLLRQDSSTVPVAAQFIPIIFNDKSDFIDVTGLDREEVIQSVFNTAAASTVKAGGLEGIYLSDTKRVVGFKKFLGLIESNFPTGNLALVQDNFLMGVFNGEGVPDMPTGRDFFILFQVSSIMDIFNDMREWEHKMFSDLRGFFGLEISPETGYLLTKDFEDGIVQNKNARILYDSNWEIVMMYVFVDNNSIIIASTENAVREIMLRLASSQIKK